MSKTIDFIFDFASPNAYFAYKALPTLLDGQAVNINIVPCLLGGIFKLTGNQAPMIAFGDIKNKLDYEMLEVKRFIKKHQLSKFVFNEHFPLMTIVLMRGAIVAEQDGRLNEYVETCLRLVWEENKKMDDPEIYIAELTAAGFDGADLLTRTQDPEVKAKLLDNTNKAVERGVFGVPSFFVGDDLYFGKDRLGQMIETL